MAKIIQQRMAAEADGSFVLFLIGMRVNRWWKVWKWWPVATAMPRMIIELYKNPELGMLHAQTLFAFPNIVVTQYWRSFEDLEAYAKDRDKAHLPAWQAFNKSVGSDGDVGIWHETYLISPGQYENVYNNMPAWGLGVAGTLHEAKGPRASAGKRLKATLPDPS
ncbi:MAG: hypothetical protein RJA87_2593 [Pseudomonadota bacterium]|jgi:hypothetical protein